MHKLILIMAALPSLAACARGSAERHALPGNALPVPIVRQSLDYTCGAAALLSTLFYWRVYDGREGELLDVTETRPLDGAPPQGLVKGAEKFGLKAYFREGVTIEDLRASLVRGDTVILDIQAWPDKPGLPWSRRREDGHYVVLTALDAKYAYFMDPAIGTGYTYIPVSELMERWRDYEDRGGKVWNNERLAVFISGKTHLENFPSALTPTN